MALGNLRLALWSGVNFSGRRILFQRRGVAVRDLRAFRFNDELSSFRVSNLTSPAQVTLVLFRDAGYQGPIRVFRGSQAVADLRRLGFNNQTSSLILVGRRLSDQEIRRIQTSRSAPAGIVTIRQ
ncbi:MAG: hypothetical protein C6W59_02875 [Paenibacillaceae bacterium]|nr:MAG: hypothetical protein C6W59_02875 [Paenibacillaceae bacterium]